MVRIRPYTKSKKRRWEYDIQGRRPDGTDYRERRSSTLTSLAALKRWVAERERYLVEQGGPSKAPKQEVPTLDAFWTRFVREHLVAERRKPSSIESAESIYRTHLAPRLAGRKLDEITDADVQALKAALADKSRSTVNNVLTVLGSALKRAVEWNVVERPPCRVRLLKSSKPEVSFYDYAEFARLLCAARALDPRIELVVLLGGDAGLRRGEFVGLEWSDLDLERRTILVQRSEWNGHVTLPKGGRGRRVKMTPVLAAALEAHRHLRGPRVLYTDAGGIPTPKVIRMWMEKAQRRAGLPVTGGVHVLRHTFCSHLAMQGAPATAIQKLAGHANLTTTMRYMHLSPGAMDAAIDLLDRRPGAGGGEVLEKLGPASAGVRDLR